MKLISTLVIIAGMGLANAAGAAESPASEAARVALAEKADLPSLRPVLPSLLGDRDSTEQGDDVRQGSSREAQREGEKTAASAAADAHAAADARKAAREAARAEADQQSASEKTKTDKVKKDNKNKNKKK